MATPQTAILPEHMLACVVIEANVQRGFEQKVRQACAQIPGILNQYCQQYPEAELGLCVGFGYDYWQYLEHHEEAHELKRFQPMGQGMAPATQCDIVFHFQSRSHGTNMLLALGILALFQSALNIVDETHGFRLPEERGYDGFVDGTENPTAEKRTIVGVIDGDSIDAGGSYLLVQRYIHDLSKWSQYSEKEQSLTIGRDKLTDEELPSNMRLPESHLGRVDLKENGQGLKIIRQSLPFGTASGEQGLLFLAYCAHLHPIEKQLKSMFGELDGKIDLVLSRMSRAISGAYYFVPSVERLRDL